MTAPRRPASIVAAGVLGALLVVVLVYSRSGADSETPAIKQVFSDADAFTVLLERRVY